MRVRGLGRLRRWRDHFRRRLQHRVAIILYHRVADLDLDPHLLAVSPQHFEQHLAVLQRNYPAFSLQELCRALANNRLPHRAVVITFDDGYADNLHHAKPLLEKYNLPATIFVATGAIGYPKEFWWDELEHLLLQPGSLPPVLTIKAGDYQYEKELGNDCNYSPMEYFSHQQWNAMMTEDPTLRHTAYRSLCQWMHPLPIRERQQVLTALRAWSGTTTAPCTSHRTLTAEEVVKLAEGGLIEVGAHTVNHHSLASLDLETQRIEIEHSKAELEQLLGYPVMSFSYPFGTRADYTLETAELVKMAGFNLACANFPGVVHHGCDRFQLPRFVVRNWDGEEFSRQLALWFNDAS